MRIRLFSLLTLLSAAGHPSKVFADEVQMKKASPNEKAPSFEQVLWTETHLAADLSADYSYAFSDGVTGAHSSELEYRFTTRALMAFLFHGGIQWQRVDFSPPASALIPEELDAINMFLATDFRWSKKDMLRIQVSPGYYTDMEHLDSNDFNASWAIAYTRIPSESFQWAIALSINPLRQDRYLPGGGFRWQINDRWKLKFFLPNPRVEYKVADAFRVWVGSDFRGDTFRMGNRFGSEHGDSRLNNALLDYREVRAGAGYSWNILPLLSMNAEAGYVLDRTWNYHNNDIEFSGGKRPYVGVNFRYLFHIEKDERSIREQLRQMKVAYPTINRFIK